MNLSVCYLPGQAREAIRRLRHEVRGRVTTAPPVIVRTDVESHVVRHRHLEFVRSRVYDVQQGRYIYRLDTRVDETNA
jgi:hypothetical protein